MVVSAADWMPISGVPARNPPERKSMEPTADP